MALNDETLDKTSQPQQSTTSADVQSADALDENEMEEALENGPDTTYGSTDGANAQAIAAAKANLEAKLPGKGSKVIRFPLNGAVIYLQPFDLARHISEAWAALHKRNASQSGPVFYRRNGGVVNVSTDEDGIPFINKAVADGFLAVLAELATWVTVSEKSEKDKTTGEKHSTLIEKSTYPPSAVAKAMLAQPHDDLPRLRRMVESPVFSADGRLLTKGYDAETATYVASNFEVAVPEVVTESDIAQARALLDDLLVDFPFETPHDRATVVALMLLPVVRDLVDGPTPIHLMEAPKQGTGKGLLAEIALWVALGRVPGSTIYSPDDEEMRKRITGVLAKGHDVILLDNVEGTVKSASLASATTQSVWEDRHLGSNQIGRYSLRNSVWVATGNNVVLTGDFPRRIVRCRLNAHLERPWDRVKTIEFRHDDLRGWVRDNRASLFSALVVFVRAWLQEGRPGIPKTQILGGFESWSKVIGGILAVAGVPGFLANQELLYEDSDVDGARWRAFVEAWWEAFKDQPIDTEKLLPLATSGDLFPQVARFGGNDQGQRTKLGQLINDHRDQVISGYTITRDKPDPKTRRPRYRLVVAEVPIPEPAEVPLFDPSDPNNHF